MQNKVQSHNHNSSHCNFSFDYLNPSPLLYISGKKRPSNLIGTILGILCYISMIIISLFFIIDFFSKREVNVLSFTENITNHSGMLLNDRIFQVRLSTINNEEVDPRLGGIKILQYSYNITDIWSKEIPIEKCGTNIQEINLNGTFNNNSGFYCFSKHYNETIEIKSDEINTYYSYLIVYAGECVNSTTNNNYCYPVDIIRNYLKQNQLYLTFYLQTTTLDHFNDASPLIHSTYLESFRLTHGFKYLYQLYYRQMKYTTDTGLVFESCINETGYYFDKSSRQTLLFTEDNKFEIENSIYQFQFTLDASSVDRYKRFYPKLQTLLANVSAAMKVINLIGRYLIEFLCSKRIFVNILDRVSSNEKRKQEDDKVLLSKKNTFQQKNPQTIINNALISVINNSQCLNNSSSFQDVLSKGLNKNPKIDNFMITSVDKDKHLNKTINKELEKGRASISFKNFILSNLFPSRNKISIYIKSCEIEVKRVMSIENVIMQLKSVDTLYDLYYNKNDNISIKPLVKIVSDDYKVKS